MEDFDILLNKNQNFSQFIEVDFGDRFDNFTLSVRPFWEQNQEDPNYFIIQGNYVDQETGVYFTSDDQTLSSMPVGNHIWDVYRVGEAGTYRVVGGRFKMSPSVFQPTD
jgi:hypothetical protein